MLVATSASAARADPPRYVIYADHDDDDADGMLDGVSPHPPDAPEILLLEDARGAVVARSGFDRARLLAKGAPVAWGFNAKAGSKLALQGLSPGNLELSIGAERARVAIVWVNAIDSTGSAVDFTRSHASFERIPPTRLSDDASAGPDALRFRLVGPRDALPATIALASMREDGTVVDRLADVPVAEGTCEHGFEPDVRCVVTAPIRVVADDLDREHPLSRGRSIKAELGGAIAVLAPNGQKAQMIRVGGPRATIAGSIARLRAKVRVLLVRLAPHGPTPLGGNDAAAIALAQAEVARSNAIWGACGVHFEGPASPEVDIAIVDPPRPSMLAIGCDLGLPATGGGLSFRVDDKAFAVAVDRGASPASVARLVAQAINARGFAATVVDNPVIGPGALGTADVFVKRTNGKPAVVAPMEIGQRIARDATLTACLGDVDLSDGVQHFGDVDAIAGTVEERALVKAFDDGDPSTIEVLVVPAFAGGGRVGESFIFADRGALRNVVLEDRAGLRVDRASFALAHELGHVLLDDPGHPDDFGADTPTRLMDADAANPTVFGPRRLSAAECARAVQKSGPRALVPLLTPEPFRRIPWSRAPSK
jgi:hypothetical protein